MNAKGINLKNVKKKAESFGKIWKKYEKKL